MVRTFLADLLIALIVGYLIVIFPPEQLKASVISAWTGSKGFADLMTTPVEVPAWYLLLAFIVCVIFFAVMARVIYLKLRERPEKLKGIEGSVLGFFSINHGRHYSREDVSAMTGVSLLPIEAAIDRLLALGLLDDYLNEGPDIKYGLSEKGRAYVMSGEWK